MNNVSKKTKTILFASLIAAMILPFSVMDVADAKQSTITQQVIDDRFGLVSDVYDDEKLAYVNGLISSLGVADSSKTKSNGDKISEKTIVSKHGKDSFKITTQNKVVTKGGDNYNSQVSYFVTPYSDGSLYIQVPDARPSVKSNVNDSNGLEFILRSESESPIPEADATSRTKKFTMEVEKTINNNYVGGSDNFVLNCGMYSTTASMHGAADANTIGNYWRAINANLGGAYIYYDWCIFAQTYEGVEFEMRGSSYNNKQWSTTWAYPGWDQLVVYNSLGMISTSVPTFTMTKTP